MISNFLLRVKKSLMRTTTTFFFFWIFFLHFCSIWRQCPLSVNYDRNTGTQTKRNIKTLISSLYLSFFLPWHHIHIVKIVLLREQHYNIFFFWEKKKKNEKSETNRRCLLFETIDVHCSCSLLYNTRHSLGHEGKTGGNRTWQVSLNARGKICLEVSFFSLLRLFFKTVWTLKINFLMRKKTKYVIFFLKHVHHSPSQ